MEAARGRLPNLAPSGRAGVRALKGPVNGPGGGRRRFQCGYARTYVAEFRDPTLFGTDSRHPTDRSIGERRAAGYRTNVHKPTHNWVGDFRNAVYPMATPRRMSFSETSARSS